MTLLSWIFGNDFLSYSPSFSHRQPWPQEPLNLLFRGEQSKDVCESILFLLILHYVDLFCLHVKVHNSCAMPVHKGLHNTKPCEMYYPWCCQRTTGTLLISTQILGVISTLSPVHCDTFRCVRSHQRC